jgi:hypothetical protein
MVVFMVIWGLRDPRSSSHARPNRQEGGVSKSGDDEFAQAVLDARPEHRMVLTADVVGFYDFVDIDLLVDRVIASTGKADVAFALGTVLRGLMGSGVGLPQNTSSSAILAELIAAPVETGPTIHSLSRS